MTIPPIPDHMMIPQTGQVCAVVKDFPSLWCVYDVVRIDPEGGPDERIYIGACKLRDVYLFPDAVKNSHWKKAVKPTTQIFISVRFTGAKVEAINMLARLLREHRPEVNKHGWNMAGLSRPIMCSNGMEYPTQTEAARALGISQGHLSLHLSGSTSHRKVNGYTFWYRD